MAILARKFPDTVPDLMAYQLLIIQTHWDYEVPPWQRYDEAFRDKAAATGNRKWSSLDPHLFNKICAGRARKVGLDASALPMARGAWDSPQGPPLKKPAHEMGRPLGGKAFQPRTSGPTHAGTGTREHVNTILASTAIPVVNVVGGTLRCNATKMRRWRQGQKNSWLQNEEKGRQKSNFEPVGLTLQDLGICCLDELECKIHRV